MHPAMSGRMAVRPQSCSKARSVASLMKVPPWTTTFRPMDPASRILMTLNSAFLMTE